MHVPDEAVRHYVNRAYQEGAAFQWARELYKNAEEAGATRVVFGIDRQAAKNGVFRRTIIDDGHGMGPEHIVSYFAMLGVSSKPIGGPDQNYGHGARVSLLPWNPAGIVVISCKDGVYSMIWMMQDATGNYGLREWEFEDEEGAIGLTPVVDPRTVKEDGVDWGKIMPSWIKDHGTAFVLLGNSLTTNTVYGDPRYVEEATARGLHQYLGGRLHRIPSSIAVTVETLEDLTKSKKTRRSSRDVELGTLDGVVVGKHDRNVIGVEAVLTKDGKVKTGEQAVDANGTTVRWYLRDEDAPPVFDSLPGTKSFIALAYDDELYDHETHSAKFRMFGIAQTDVRNRVWLIIRPPKYDSETAIGVYPNQSRSSLLWRGGQPPLSDWALTFAKSLPAEIQEALSKAYASESSTTTSIEDDKERRERLAARFGKRWRAIRYVLSRALGTIAANPADGQLPKRPTKPKPPNPNPPQPDHHGGRGGSSNDGPRRLGQPDASGSEMAVERRVGVDLPKHRWAPASDFQDEQWAAAVWQPAEGESGTVVLNQDHPLFTTEIQHWQTSRPSHYADGVRETVQEVYTELAIAHVAHIRNFSGSKSGNTVITDDLVKQMLEATALTAALSGLLGAEAMIQTRLGGRFGKAA